MATKRIEKLRKIELKRFDNKLDKELKIHRKKMDKLSKFEIKRRKK